MSAGDGGVGCFWAPNLLLQFNFYTDSIGDKPVQFLNTDKAHRNQNDDQKELCVGDGTTHDAKYPFIDEFSEFLRTVSTSALKNKLMTYQQRLLAKAMWEAENYGGSISKCKERLKELYGPNWPELVNFDDHFTPERDYCEYVLILDHIRQWNQHEKVAKLRGNQPNNDAKEL